MKQMIMIITTMILIVGGAITILSIQIASAGPINTSRSNIKSLVVEPSGDNSQATSQDVDTEVITSMDNTCSESECSNSINISFGDNTNDGSKQPPNN
jgi:ABC-type microcin C transport system permease subunit YejB